ncbi:MAG: hypothetical protein R6X13_05005 [bacterium]
MIANLKIVLEPVAVGRKPGPGQFQQAAGAGPDRDAAAVVGGITASIREISDSKKDELAASIDDLKAFTAMLSSNTINNS